MPRYPCGSWGAITSPRGVSSTSRRFCLNQAVNGRLPTEPFRGPVIIRAFVGLAAAIAIAGCGATKTTTATTTTAGSTSAAPTSQSSAPAWEPGTPVPKITPALIRQAGYELTVANANPGTVDEVFGALPANVHVNPSARGLNDQYARFGRCMGEYLRIHDLGHELALLVAYNRKDRRVQSAVEKASSVCEGLAIAPDARYKQSLRANP